LASGESVLLEILDLEPLRNLRNRIASLSDLAHRVTLKLFADI
jgi:hypothetical protein